MHDESSMDFLAEAAENYHRMLATSSVATDWLESRGIDENVSRFALLGFVAEPMPGHEQFAGHISIPYITPSGVRGLKFRRVDDGSPKYNAPLGQSVRMYNVGALRTQSETLVLCEGELDTIVMHHIAGIPAVGIAGVSNFKAHYPRMLRGFANVIICVDNDQKQDGANPGQDLARRIVDSIPRARNVLLPGGMDVNEFYLAEGAEALRHKLGVHG